MARAATNTCFRATNAAATQDTVGDDAATFTLTFNEVERHIA